MLGQCFTENNIPETFLANVETTVINDLEAGNRQAGMKRLKGMNLKTISSHMFLI